jgi:hypothetical protein
MKTRRQAVLLELIDREPLHSQEVLAPPPAAARLRGDAGHHLARHP